MKPLDLRRDLADAEPLRQSETLTPTKIAKAARAAALRSAAEFFSDPSLRGRARKVHKAFCQYREGAWRRERIEQRCPARRVGRIEEHLWHALKARDASISEITVRRALSGGFDPATQV